MGLELKTELNKRNHGNREEQGGRRTSRAGRRLQERQSTCARKSSMGTPASLPAEPQAALLQPQQVRLMSFPRILFRVGADWIG